MSENINAYPNGAADSYDTVSAVFGEDAASGAQGNANQAVPAKAPNENESIQKISDFPNYSEYEENITNSSDNSLNNIQRKTLPPPPQNRSNNNSSPAHGSPDSFMPNNNDSSFLYNQCVALSIRILNMCAYLKDKSLKEKKGKFAFFIGKALESGTSIGIFVKAMDRTKDFDSYFARADKALAKIDEFIYWLDALKSAKLLSGQQYISMAADCDKIKDDLEHLNIGK